MRIWAFLAAGLLAFMAAQAWGLSTEEVLRLKKAGVSDETIQKMIEQEQKGSGSQSPVSETKDEVIYRAGQSTPQEVERDQRHEAWKEQKSMDNLGGVIVDQRRPLPPRQGQGAGAGGN